MRCIKRKRKTMNNLEEVIQFYEKEGVLANAFVRIDKKDNNLSYDRTKNLYFIV